MVDAAQDPDHTAQQPSCYMSGPDVAVTAVWQSSKDRSQRPGLRSRAPGFPEAPCVAEDLLVILVEISDSGEFNAANER